MAHLSEHPLAAVDVDDRSGDGSGARRAQEGARPRQLLWRWLAPDGDGREELLLRSGVTSVWVSMSRMVSMNPGETS